MGIFLEILKFEDATGDNMVARIPAEGPADIKSGAQLIVQQSQRAVFFKDGKALDTMGPGKHTLTTENIPILTKLLSLPFGFQSPFESFVYFVSMKSFTDLKWGTKEPIVFRDKELMMVRLRAFGKFSIKITDPQLFVAEVVGTQGYVATSQVTRFLKDIIVQNLNDILGETLTSILDLPMKYNEIAAGLRAKVADSFSKYGVEATDMILSAVTPPEEVQKAIDRRTSMALAGDMNQFMQYQMAENMGNFAKNPGGMAGMGAQVGMGVQMGNMMAGAFQQPGQQRPPQGYPPQGYGPPGYPPQHGYPPQGYPPRGYPPPHGYPPQGYPPQHGYPPQGYGPPGYPPQGYPPQGRPPGPPGAPPSGPPGAPQGAPPGPQGAAPHGYPPGPQGAPPHGYPPAPHGYPPQGYPPQAAPPGPPPGYPPPQGTPPGDDDGDG